MLPHYILDFDQIVQLVRRTLYYTNDLIDRLVLSLTHGSTELSTILLSIGLAIITFFIPISIAIYNMRDFEGDKDFKELDKNVLLDYVFKAKRLFFYFILLFVPLVFWNIGESLWKMFIVLLWFIGFGGICTILRNSYRWVKEDKFTFRKKYLRRVKSPVDKVSSWNSFWSVEKIVTGTELEFFSVFSNDIDKGLKDEGK